MMRKARWGSSSRGLPRFLEDAVAELADRPAGEFVTSATQPEAVVVLIEHEEPHPPIIGRIAFME